MTEELENNTISLLHDYKEDKCMKVIGLGAAGNKAVTTAIANKVISAEDTLLMNSTMKDFPKDVEAKNCVLLSDVGGCGKERNIGTTIIKKFLDNIKNREKLNEFFPQNESQVVLVTSMGGGTGSGATNMLAQFFKNNLDLDVTIVAFKGFSEDVRELQNTVEFLQEIDKGFCIEVIDNSSFMKDANNNKIKAEKLANDELCKRLIALQGKNLVASDQNIDQTDLYKLSTMPGYQSIEFTEIKDVKNLEAMEKTIKDMLDNSRSLETIPSAKVMGVMLQVKEETLNYFDWSYKQLKVRFGKDGEIYEIYPHIQPAKDGYEWISVIVSGMKLPIEAMQKAYNEYKERTEKVDKSEDNFLTVASNMMISEEDNIFSRGMRRNRNVNLEESVKTSNGFVGGLKKRNVDIEKPTSNGKVTIEKVKEKF